KTCYLLGPPQTFAPQGARRGDPIFQPAIGDGGDPKTDQVAELADWRTPQREGDNEAIGAIAKLLPGVSATNEILGIGPITGVATQDELQPGSTMVQTVGRTTPFIKGHVEVLAVKGELTPLGRDPLPARFKNLIVVSPQGGQPFSSPGDLGAPVLTESRHLAGMVYAVENKRTYVVPIEPILDALKVHLVLP